MSVRVYRNFLTSNECEVLSQIALLGMEEGWCKPCVPAEVNRYTSRIHMAKHKYPETVLNISSRVRKFLDIDCFPPIYGHGKDGIVVSITFKDGYIHEHKDPRSIKNFMTYRCNIVTQLPEEGCDVYVDGKKVDTGVGDLHCYMASELNHYVTKSKEQTPRILWMFGACIPLEKGKEYL
jgi:hypothetical protein